MLSVLLAFGDTLLGQACREMLESAGHAAFTVNSVAQAEEVARRVRLDVVCLDGSDLGASAICWTQQAGGKPVVRVGAPYDAAKELLPLPLGAEDFIAAVQAAVGLPPLLGTSRLKLDRSTRHAHCGNREIKLTRTEFVLVELLLRNAPRPMRREEVVKGLWRYGDDASSAILLRSHVRNVRIKLHEIGLPNAIVSVRGVGYTLTV